MHYMKKIFLLCLLCSSMPTYSVFKNLFSSLLKNKFLLSFAAIRAAALGFVYERYNHHSYLSQITHKRFPSDIQYPQAQIILAFFDSKKRRIGKSIYVYTHFNSSVEGARLFVERPYRNKGIGSKIIQMTKQDILKNYPGVKYATWTITSYDSPGKNNASKRLHDFYRKNGAIVNERERTGYYEFKKKN